MVDKTSKGKEICLAFVDLKKAFDNIFKQVIWKSMGKRARQQDKNKHGINFVNGLVQEGMLTLTLFIMAMDDIVCELHNKVHKVKIEYSKLQMVKLAEYAFADNLMIYAENKDKLQQSIE